MLTLGRIVKITTMLAIVFFALPTFAQTFGNKTFTIQIQPQSPAPGDLVRANLQSVDIDLDVATVSWSLDGVEHETGIGKSATTFRAAGPGVEQRLDVSVVDQSGKLVRRSSTISASSIDVLWQATNSYTPPFYKGKALPITQSQIRAVAMPEFVDVSGDPVSPKQIVYAWQKDGRNQVRAQGYGENSLDFTHNYLEEINTLRVKASYGGRSYELEKDIVYHNPEILFYSVDSSGRPSYRHTLKDRDTVPRGIVRVVAEPFFYVKQFKESNAVEFTWEVNGQEIDSPLKNQLNLNTRDSDGNLRITTSYNNTNQLFRRSDESINLNVR